MSCLSLLLTLITFSAPFQGADLVKDFKRYFKKYEDTATRVEAVLALEEIERPEVAEVLAPILADGDGAVVRACERVLSEFRTEPPIARVAELLGKSKKTPVRVGLLHAIAEGGYGTAADAVEPLLEDQRPEVRRAALVTWAALRGGDAVEALLALVEDKDDAVRSAALDALAGIGSSAVVPAAIANLDHGSWPVRASAISALAKVRSRDSIAPLIERLGKEEGRLQEDIGEALDAITGKSLGRRLSAWESFWERFGDEYQIPTDEELAAMRASRAASRRAYGEGEPGSVSYHGIETPSRSILFVIDVSGSMEQEVVDRERYADGGYPSFRRIDIVKTELARTIDHLEPYVRFNVLTFATELRFWKKGLVPANPLYRSSAVEFVSKLDAIGGRSLEGRGPAAALVAADMAAGKTNTYGALMAALGVDGRRSKKKAKPDAWVDTIFFLSDGRPSVGEYIDTDDIRAEVRRENETRRIVIHTLAIGEFERGFMKSLALESGGVYVDLGK